LPQRYQLKAFLLILQEDSWKTDVAGHSPRHYALRLFYRQGVRRKASVAKAAACG